MNLKYEGKKVCQYTIDRLLGEGRYGLCFLARSENGSTVVIKKYKKGLRKNNIRDCIDEAVILSQLKDERIPEFLGVINEKGFYGFVLEYKNGCTVKDLLFKHSHKFSGEEFYHIGIQLINIIKYLHDNGIVHRDIRIPNVVIDQGKVYLIDFGLARWAEKTAPYDLDFTYLGDFFLYLLYSSFEKTTKRKPWVQELLWYDEISLTQEQKVFLRRLFGLETQYESIHDIETDFVKVFTNVKQNNSV